MREQLIHRPLIGVLIGLVCGLSLTFGVWPFVALLLICIGVREPRFCLLVLVAFGLGYLIRSPEPAGFFEQIHFGGVATVVSVPEQFSERRLAMVEIQGNRYRLYSDQNVRFQRGDRLRVSGILGPLSEASGYGGGARGQFIAESVEIVAQGPIWWDWGSGIGSSFRDSVIGGLSTESAALVRGVCFNQTDGLDSEDWESFRKFGIIHLLSASGFHVVVVAGMLLGVVSLLPVPRLWQLGIVFIVLGLFAIAAGFKPPILRSILMTMTVLPAYAFRREADGLSAVAFAGVINLVLNPAVLVDLGFHLSMLTTFGLVMVITQRRWQEWNWVQRLVYPSLVASLASFPLIGYVFGEVSLTGILGNVIVAPLVGLLVVVSLLTWIVGLLVPPIGAVLWKAIEPFASLVTGIVRLGSELPGGRVLVPAYSWIGVCCIYGLILITWRRYALD